MPAENVVLSGCTAALSRCTRPPTDVRARHRLPPFPAVGLPGWLACRKVPGMITIYHLDTSRSERIVWLMEELGLDYEVEVFERGPDIFAPEELKRVHPLGRAPVIRDGDTVLAESGAIVEYVVARHGGGRLAVAPSEPGFARYLYWLHYAEGSLMLQLLREASLDRMLPDADATPGMRGCARRRACTCR